MFFPHCRNLWTMSQWLFQCMLCHYITGSYLVHPCLKPHYLNYLTDSNVSCSFADTAVIGLQTHSLNPIKNPLWVLPRILCYIVWILFTWSLYFWLFWTSKSLTSNKWKENPLWVQFQFQMNSGQIFTNASILGY